MLSYVLCIKGFLMYGQNIILIKDDGSTQDEILYSGLHFFTCLFISLFYLRYLDWGMGKKTLPLNHILGILLEMKKTGKNLCCLTNSFNFFPYIDFLHVRNPSWRMEINFFYLCYISFGMLKFCFFFTFLLHFQPLHRFLYHLCRKEITNKYWSLLLHY